MLRGLEYASDAVGRRAERVGTWAWRHYCDPAEADLTSDEGWGWVPGILNADGETIVYPVGFAVPPDAALLQEIHKRADEHLAKALREHEDDQAWRDEDGTEFGDRL